MRKLVGSLLLALALAAPGCLSPAPALANHDQGNGKSQDHKKCPAVTCEACPDPGPIPAAAPCVCSESGCHRCAGGSCQPCVPECQPEPTACPPVTVEPCPDAAAPVYAICRARPSGKVHSGDVVVDGVPYKCPRKAAPYRFFVPIQ